MHFLPWCFQWSPKVYSPSKDYALRSPSSMKKPAVNLKNSPSSRKDNPRVLFTETEKAGNVKSSRSSLNRRLFKNASKEANDAEFVRERKRKKSREDEVPSGRKHELLENEKTDDKTPSSKATCRDDFGKRRKRPHRRSSGDDDADDDGGNRKTENEANFTRRHSDAKGHRYSRVRAKERKSTSSFPSMRTTAVNERTGKVIARERLRRRAPPCNAFSDDSSDDENVPCVTRLSAVNRPSQRRTAPQKSPPSLIRKHHVGSASHRKFMSSRKKAITDISKSAEKRWTSRRHTPSSSSSASTVETVPMLDGEEVFRETSNTNHKLRLRNEVKKTQEADSIELNTNVVPHPNVLHDYPRSDDAHSESAAPTSLNSM
ncbi:hypothetical protein AB6A40_009806 [Gnathostoma spinigerum]|uniref:Uncharacterized protein n=1 Tax=Gnathostoma spinigerum TaxID=75299 RepID=A0ABD6EVG3_9BILA